MMRKIVGIALGVIVKLPIIIVLSAATLIIVNSLCVPVYQFTEPQPFRGSGFYNPYQNFDTIRGLQKANFHAHSKINNLFNGHQTIEQVVDTYRQYGYDIVGVSNYQTISRYATDPSEHIPVYEHGYNPQKFHQLVFGSQGLTRRDVILPVTTSARQWMISHESKNADAVCINHPQFTAGFSVENMKYLRGYRFIEANAGMSPAFEWWDTGLSSGIPSFILSGDDSHNVAKLHDFATHGVVINTDSKAYSDIIGELKQGNYYALQVPSFSEKLGDYDSLKLLKLALNHALPKIDRIQLRGDTLKIGLSASAQAINFIGQGGVIQKTVQGFDAEYVITNQDTYIRAEVLYENGVKFYTNPVFRTNSQTPFEDDMPQVDIFLTSLLVLGRIVGIAVLGVLVYILSRRLFRSLLKY